MYDCIFIGDCVFDVNLFIHEAAVHCKLDKTDCELCLKYGQKIPVDSISRGLGGNAANNVVGLTRLGLTTGFYTIYGDDQIGERIGQYLDVEKIDKSLVKVEPGAESRYSTIVNFSGERTILTYNVDRKYVLPAHLPETKWIYISSVGINYEELFIKLSDFVKSKNIKLAYAPTGNELVKPASTYQGLLAASQIVFLNKEEAVKIVGAGEIKKLLFGIRDLGAKIVVITDGTNGSFVYDGDKYYQIGIFDLPVAQRTGAGDAYASAFMAAIMKDLPITEAMRWGVINAASVVSKMGTQTGLLMETELAKFLTENPNFQPLTI